MPLPGWNDELRDLGESVNDMAQRLAQLQEAVQQTERLRLLGQVGGGLAHQLRNSVTGARLAVQLHAQDCNGKADTEALEVALRQLTLMEERLRRFLDLGRTGEARREPCSLNDLIDEAVSLLRPQCRHAHIDLSWHRPAEHFSVLGDADQLAHVLVNVIGNAIEAAGPGGSVVVSLRTLEGKDSCAVEVMDSGPGPPPEIAERLFEPFVTSRRDGIGLGLAVAREVAQTHGGSITWRRENDRTCFRIELPLATAAQPQEPRDEI
jgi:signal transduction histidine kinase